MNKEAINKQIENLMAQGKQLETQLHMINGALQDCNYWLKELEKHDASEEISDTQSV
jgi:chaperonin cofactor prefoldin